MFKLFKISRQMLLLATTVALINVATTGAARADVIIQPTPDNGLQPRISVDENGLVHLLYFKKHTNRPAAREGNLYYRQYDPAAGSFGLPVKVSSQAFSMLMFSFARAAMAIDGEGRAHVLWYLPRSNQYFYTRSNQDRNRFEPQRPMVSQYTEGIEAGADIAARGSQVAIFWGAGDLSREYERTVFARFSHDSGASFGAEIMVSNPDLGVCVCCSLAGDYMNDSELLVAYRSAIDGIGRHMQLLTVENVDNEITGATYTPVSELREWESSACPVSTNDIGTDANANHWLVFETSSRIVQMNLHSLSEPTLVGEPFTKTRQKNPAIAINNSNERLVVWGEAISHTRGGRLNMRLFDAAGNETNYQFKEEITIPNHSFPAAASLANGDFLVLY